MNTIAHISDVHIPVMPRVKLAELLNKRITGYANWKLARGSHMNLDSLNRLVDHLRKQRPSMTAMTGDLVNLALDKEVTYAAQWLKRLGPPERVCLIPGNHDAYVPGARRRAGKAYGAYATGETVSGKTFPFVRRVGDVAIVGCCSGVAMPPFVAAGRISAGQAERLGRCLKILGDAGYFRIVLIHHPPFLQAPMRHKLFGTELFREAVTTNGAELILHGHTHLSTLNAIEGGDKPIPLVGVTAAATTPGSREAPARYNLFQIERLGNGWSCTMREFGYQRIGEDIVQRLQMRII